ncbi:MAG TPA: VOC family protein [Vicinamibacteria bacterium]
MRAESQPRYELDHVFVCTDVGAPEADALARLGLAEGAPNTHPGQGTACRRFFFDNAYIELVWVSDADEARGELAAPARLWERWSGRGHTACPFALIFRGDDGAPPPFDTWPYRPPYLPPDVAIEVARGTSLGEPELFYITAARRPRRASDHALPLREISRVEVQLPQRARSAAARAAEATGLVALRSGDEYLMEVGFDGERAGGRADLRPRLPLVLRW